MTPAARVAAATEVLDSYLSGTPAEQALTGWARSHRFAGSKDRAAIRDHVFDALRRLRSSQALGGGTTGRATMIGLLRGQDADLASLFSGEGYAPAPLSDSEQNLSAELTRAERLDCPDWLMDAFDDSLGNDADTVLDMQRHRAPVFLRANLARKTRSEVADMLAAEGIATRISSLSPSALEVTENPRKINASRAYLDGYAELQDAASQAVVDFLNVTPGLRVLDYCAGGGGKALALAAFGAEVVAHDISPKRMQDIPQRATRAGARIRVVTPNELEDEAPFDLVFADAPCSGSGSWRRAPAGKWLIDSAKMDELLGIQAGILNKLPSLTKPGGSIAYATCSLLRSENRDQVSAFCGRNSAWRLHCDRQFTPLDGADGFYVAQLKEK